MRAMWVEANLPGKSKVIAQFLLQIHNKIMFINENEGQSNGAQLVPVDGKYRNL